MNKYESIYKSGYSITDLRVHRMIIQNELDDDDRLLRKSQFLGELNKVLHLKIWYSESRTRALLWYKKNRPKTYRRLLKENKVKLP